MTEFTDAERQEWHAARREGMAIDDDDHHTSDASCSHCGTTFNPGGGMVTDGFALCAACDGN